ncbi:MAG TPA: dTMP kinase [Armatimonadota bacterium]|nr:dTMP kinase [Armatimonadota bacterium]
MEARLPPYFITLEGPEGSGKSTQARLLADALENLGLKVKLTREPGGDPVSEEIRKILLDGPDHSVVDRTELFLYLAARAQHTERVIRPSLEAGFTVVCARYIDSTVAYQGYGSGLDLELIHRMNAFATGGLAPDLTLLLDIPVETGLRRQDQWNRMERKAIEYHQRVRRGFLEEARLSPDRIVVIDASGGLEAVQREILRHAGEKLEITL